MKTMTSTIQKKKQDQKLRVRYVCVFDSEVLYFQCLLLNDSALNEIFAHWLLGPPGVLRNTCGEVNP